MTTEKSGAQTREQVQSLMDLYFINMSISQLNKFLHLFSDLLKNAEFMQNLGDWIYPKLDFQPFEGVRCHFSPSLVRNACLWHDMFFMQINLSHLTQDNTRRTGKIKNTNIVKDVGE